MASVLFAEQEAFGAQVTKEKLAVEWALEQVRGNFVTKAEESKIESNRSDQSSPS